jgi:hypothetical protein
MSTKSTVLGLAVLATIAVVVGSSNPKTTTQAATQEVAHVVPETPPVPTKIPNVETPAGSARLAAAFKQSAKDHGFKFDAKKSSCYPLVDRGVTNCLFNVTDLMMLEIQSKNDNSYEEFTVVAGLAEDTPITVANAMSAALVLVEVTSPQANASVRGKLVSDLLDAVAKNKEITRQLGDVTYTAKSIPDIGFVYFTAR